MEQSTQDFQTIESTTFSSTTSGPTEFEDLHFTASEKHRDISENQLEEMEERSIGQVRSTL